MIAQSRRLSLIAFHRWAFYPFDRIVGYGISFAQILEQR